MDIWTGSITLDSTTPPLEDLRLSTPSTSTAPSSVTSHLTKSLSSSTLSLISLIDPTRIPLFLAAGPSLELTTTSPTTELYFRQLFLSKLPLSTSSSCAEQSRVALLVSVTNPSEHTPGDWQITELAIYGAISQLPVPKVDVATPPHSSAPLEDQSSVLTATTPTTSNLRTIVTVHALPLSSNHAFPTFLPKIKQEKTFTIREDPAAAAAAFIAPNPQDVINPPTSSKKRGADVIDSIVEKRKRAKARQQSAPAPPPPLTLLGSRALNRIPSLEPRSAGIKNERSPSPTGLKLRRSSGGGTPGVVLGPISVFKREGTESRPSTAVKREGSDCFGSGGATVKREVSDIETRNRDILAKVVVARMKACGIRDYRSKSIMPTTPITPVADENGEKREKEEYKNIYHHTVKAAVFALVGITFPHY
ncbi:hypothetical protein L873DRAFT_1789112 [Choiromyces venosus 120613-1]|uniref:Sld7 C-terminal domain-containing protein n=1 Tax=Choiromyces venosus 120613-1 TaxID=1336337 RepID=A0A3N4JTJ4_9PEZI|nr:hypothetical protein L873DRAFT_1789112 [Choiromyces venosus 120613-1]